MNFSAVVSILKAAKRVALFTHIRPDGDAVGSTLALKCFLERAGKAVDVFCESQIPQKFLFLKGAEEIRDEIRDFSYDLAVAVDTSNPERLGVLGKPFLKFKNTLCIDHHVSNTRYAKENVVSDDGSCAETVYKMLKYAGAAVDKALAEYLFVGIVTDTGGFLQSNTNAETFGTAAELAATGIDFSAIAIKVFKSQTINKFNLERRGLNSVRFFENGRIAVISFSVKDMAETGTELADTEGMVNAVLYIEGVEVSIAIVEAKGGYKVSFRSRGDIDVNAAAGTFGGGGHKNASGCVINVPFEEVVEKTVRAASLELK